MKKLSLPKITLLGIKLPSKTTNRNEQAMQDCGALWQRFEQEKVYAAIPTKLREEVYAVYFDYEGDHTAPYSYFIGCPVEDSTSCPPGLETLTIPADSFLKLTARGKMPDCVANAWREIWKSDYGRSYHFDFEIYDQRSQDWSNAEVDIYLSAER
ncbi:GyrI-like domain-containing protein [Algoriphagus halophytocola]|uniref:GyrI-like domain-containing protein n=1 Tax=Algoriphagus halophytocola TaxID=2991499 RepID=A0ABY6MJG1_9BACT|nr:MULTISPECIES: GyrI-like domain-containing protein [unclassified Algoriphagus]UZD23629.1 GyrI-like domain-containing protein [Algoriphagus sp. TR-M5]WBL44922.1 GyrI-like domain-containing protein [Algoriphagus sp. TR-M9]